MTFKKLVVYTDGASRGNPGPAAIGVVIHDEGGKVLATISEVLGDATNNQAEYRAVISGLEKALSLGGATNVELRSDSELVVNQLSGKYRVKNAELKPLFLQVDELFRRFKSFEVVYIPREQNREADKLANRALDSLKLENSHTPISYPVIVRPAIQADFPGIIEIMAQTERLHVEGVPRVFRVISSRQKLKDLEDALSDATSDLLVAVSAGEVLGYIQLCIKESEKIRMLKARRYAKVRNVAVKQEFRLSGAGSALMRAADRWAKEKGLDCIEVNVWEFNSGALSFYQKMGYTTFGRGMWKDL